METPFENILTKIVNDDSDIDWVIVCDSKGSIVGSRGLAENKRDIGVKIAEIMSLALGLYTKNSTSNELIDIDPSQMEIDMLTIQSEMGPINIKKNDKYIFAMKKRTA